MKRWLAVAFACFAIVLCGTVLTDHAQAETSANQACSASCHNHGQPISGQAGTLLKLEDNDKEPTPPFAYWLSGAFALVLLYPATRYAAISIRPIRQLYLQQACLRF